MRYMRLTTRDLTNMENMHVEAFLQQHRQPQLALI